MICSSGFPYLRPANGFSNHQPGNVRVICKSHITDLNVRDCRAGSAEGFRVAGTGLKSEVRLGAEKAAIAQEPEID